MMSTAQLKFGDIHYILREELDAVVAEPLLHQWTEVIRKLQQQESEQSNSKSRHNTRDPKTESTSDG